MTDPTRLTPQEAWDTVQAGNARFAAGRSEHPHADAARRRELAEGQHPHTVVFVCSDSRPVPELVFDQGLGDLFVVRNAGQVINPSSLGSLEYGIGPLDAALLVVIGHQSCGAVRAAIDSTRADAPELPPAIWQLIAPIAPVARRVAHDDGATPETVDAGHVGREHVRQTIADLLARSPMTAKAVADGRLGIVGAEYRLAEGTILPYAVEGALRVDAR